MTEMNIDYAIQIIWSVEDQAYIAFPAELPGCFADGQTQEEALANLREVIKEWIEVAREEGREVPSPMSVQEYAKVQEKMRQEFEQDIHNRIQQEVEKAVQSVVQQITSTFQEERSSRYVTGGFQMGARMSLLQSLEHGSGVKR